MDRKELGGWRKMEGVPEGPWHPVNEDEVTRNEAGGRSGEYQSGRTR